MQGFFILIVGKTCYHRVATLYCGCFHTSGETYSMLLWQQIWCLGKFLSLGGLTNFMLKWMCWCGSQGSYDDFCLWDI